ncbi:ABC transporter permease [Magnetovibrio sp.]|uniref:ABC transporter permease n=1 Tax=Magnetovibrio sp. TaxID=2024836 RepID=UPI002F938221
MSFFKSILLAINIARRDLRGGLRGRARTLGLLVAGVLVGVAAVALVGACSQSLRDGARQGGLEAVGGDLSLRLFHRAPSVDELAAIAREGQASVTAELRPMVQFGTRSLLVELKGVDAAYPLYGEVQTTSPTPLAALLQDRGAVADAAVFDDLGLSIGDEIVVGAQTYTLRAKLVSEPDRAFRAFSLGPRVMVALDGLAETGLAAPGAEIYFYTRVKLAPTADAGEALKRIDARFPGSGWRMVNGRDGVPGVERTLAMAHVLLLFLGLGVMLVGGAGISGAVRAHITAKMDIIAILKSIGTPPNVIAYALGFEVLAGAGVGALLGVAVGAFGPALAVGAVADQLPFDLSPWPSAKALVGAAGFGLLVALLFAWWPLMAVRSVTTRQLLRERFDHVPGRIGCGGALGVLLILSGLVALVFWVSPMAVLTGAFLLGGLVLALLFYALGRALMRMAQWLSRRASKRSVLLRLALGNLHRGGAPTAAVTMALGLTLTLLVALDGIERAATRHVATTLPATAPDLVLFSMPKDRADDLDAALARWDGLQSKRIMPFLHARVEAIGGVAVRDLNIPASLNWVVRGDRGVSFASSMPAGSTLTDGAWWPPQDERRLLSVDAAIAAKLGVGVGDTITLNVSGLPVTGRIANLRRIDWTRLDLDFPILASPGALQDVPHTYAAAVKAKPGRGPDMERLIAVQFGEVARVRVEGVIQALASALDALVAGLRIAALMTGAAALVVLAGSVVQGLSARLDEALLFKVLGAKRSQMLIHLAVEFATLGVLVSLIAVPLGMTVAAGVSRAAGLADATIAIGGGVQLALIATLVTVAVGLLATWGAYASAPSRYLRNRGV